MLDNVTEFFKTHQNEIILTALSTKVIFDEYFDNIKSRVFKKKIKENIEDSKLTINEEQKISKKGLGQRVEDVEENKTRVLGGLEIKSSTDYWTVSGVNYRNVIHRVDLLKSLLDNGNTKTQDKWIEYSKAAKQRNDFYVGDFPLYHALFRALFLSKDSSDKTQVEEARTFLEKQFNEKWLMTLTRVRYMPQGKDIVIHNFGMPDKLEIPKDFTGPDELVKDTRTPQVYNSLLGTSNIQEIQDIYEWLTKKPAYLYRVNTKPKTALDSVARFDAGSVRPYLSCGRLPSEVGASLGVRGCCGAAQKI